MDQILAHQNSICPIFKRSLRSSHHLSLLFITIVCWNRNKLNSSLLELRNDTYGFISFVLTCFFFFFTLLARCPWSSLWTPAIFGWPVKAVELNWLIQSCPDKLSRTNQISLTVNYLLLTQVDGVSVRYFVCSLSDWICPPHHKCSRLNS